MIEQDRAFQTYVNSLTNSQKIAFSSIALATEQARKAAEYLPLVKNPEPNGGKNG